MPVGVLLPEVNRTTTFFGCSVLNVKWSKRKAVFLFRTMFAMCIKPSRFQKEKCLDKKPGQPSVKTAEKFLLSPEFRTKYQSTSGQENIHPV